MDNPLRCASKNYWSMEKNTVHHYNYNGVSKPIGRWSNEHKQYESVQSGKNWETKAIVTLPSIKNTSGPEKGSFLNLFAGGIAGCASTLVTCPIDVIKTRQQSSSGKASSNSRLPINAKLAQIFLRNHLRAHSSVATQHVFACPRSMLQHGRCIIHAEGLRSFYKGLGPSLMGVVPSRALFFYAYEVAKKSLTRKFGFCTNSSNTHILAASFGGFVCTSATCPLWVVKTKQQLHRRVNKTSLSMLECIRRLWLNEGFKGFYRGLTASYAGIVETVIYFTIYEQLKMLYIRKHNLDLCDANISMSTFWELPGLMVISSLSKCTATCIAYPHEVVRTRLREEPVKRKYNGFFQTVKYISNKEGLRGLYAGLPAQLIRQVPNMAILMGVYEGVLYLARQ